MAMDTGRPWGGVDEVVARLGLSVDPDDLGGVLAAVVAGMKRDQNTDFFEHWLSAHRYLEGLADRGEPPTDDGPLDEVASGGSPGALVPAPTQDLVGVQVGLATQPSAAATVAFTEAQYQDLLARSGDRAKVPITVRRRRRTFTLAAIAVVVGLVWGVPQTAHPVLKSLSPYQVVDEGSNDERTEIEPLRATAWVLLLLIGGGFSAAAWRRQTHESNIIADLHEPAYHAQALRRLARENTFTQVAFEEALMERRDVIRHPSRAEPQPAVPIGGRVALSVVLGLAAAGLVVANSFMVGDALSYDLDAPSTPGIAIVACMFGVVLCTFGFAALWLGEPQREALIGVLRLRPYEETLDTPLHSAAELALERYVARGTIVLVDDYDFLPTYRFVRSSVHRSSDPSESTRPATRTFSTARRQ